MPRPGLPILALLAALALAGSAAAHTGSQPYGHTGSHLPGLPDLYSDRPDGERLEQYAFGGTTGTRLLLRFNGYIHNEGTAGTLELHGAARSGSEMATVNQRVYSGDGTTWVDHPVPAARVLYETSDGHLHWHLRDAARYTLARPEGGSAVPGAKVGFCMIDSTNDHYLDIGPYIPTEWYWETAEEPGHGNCGEYDETASAVTMGLTPGWRDDYESDVHYQWIDISNVRPGPYKLGSEVDPNGLIRERDEVNPVATTDVTVPGYVAEPATESGLSPLEPSTIQLRSTSFSGPLRPSLGARQFRIDAAPADGTLDRPVGTWFDAASVQYTPDPGAEGSDSFRFSVREAGNPFPLNPVSATATVELTGPAPAAEQVAISGAPPAMETATTAQLTATVSNPRGTGAIAWSVDGGGSITPGGLYTAPNAVPAGRTVTVRATSDRGATAATTIEIVAPVPRQPAPTDPVEPEPEPGTGLPGVPPPITRVVPERRTAAALANVRATRQGRYVVVSLVPGRTGRLKSVLMAGRRKLATCASPATAGRRSTCRIRVRRARGRLSVVVSLRSADTGATVTKRVTVKRVAAPQ